MRPTKVERLCQNCGNVFKVYPYNIKKLYCNKNCFQEAKTRDIVCANCGKTFKVALTDVAIRKYCNIDCRIKGDQKKEEICTVVGWAKS